MHCVIAIEMRHMFTLGQYILVFVISVAAFFLCTFVYVSRDKKGRISLDRTMLVMSVVPILSAMAIFAVVIFLLG